MALADILNTNPQDFVMEAYADPLQYFEPDPPNDTKPEEVLEKLQKNDASLKDVSLNNVMGISEQLFCDIFNALKNNDKLVMEAYADPLQYFEPDPPNDTKPEEMLEKIQNNDKETKDVCLNNIAGISEQLFCDIF